MQKETETITPQWAKERVSVIDSVNKSPTIIKGILTSRIEVKPSTDIPAYGFIKLDKQETEIPIIFRIKGEQKTWIKPQIKRNSLVELTGFWAENSNSNRPSFTVTSYQIIAEPKPSTIKSLQADINNLLSTSLSKLKEWKERVDFLYKKLDELKEIDTLTRFGSEYLAAYLLLKSVSYANYQPEHLPLTNFDQEKYLANIASELEQVNKHIVAYQRRNHE